MGCGNRGRYSNPEVDRRIAAALETIDDAERERLTREATAIAMADVAVRDWQLHTIRSFLPS